MSYLKTDTFTINTKPLIHAVTDEDGNPRNIAVIYVAKPTDSSPLVRYGVNEVMVALHLSAGDTGERVSVGVDTACPKLHLVDSTMGKTVRPGKTLFFGGIDGTFSLQDWQDGGRCFRAMKAGIVQEVVFQSDCRQTAAEVISDELATIASNALHEFRWTYSGDIQCGPNTDAYYELVKLSLSRVAGGSRTVEE